MFVRPYHLNFYNNSSNNKLETQQRAITTMMFIQNSFKKTEWSPLYTHCILHPLYQKVGPKSTCNIIDNLVMYVKLSMQKIFVLHEY